MFAFLDPIPVSFGPHDADWWMVWLTGASVLTSGVLALLAYLNGRKALRIAAESAHQAAAAAEIADDAAQREEAYRLRVEAQEVAAKRGEVALAMSLAVNSDEMHWLLARKDPTANPETKAIANGHYLDALARIDTMADVEEGRRLRLWLNSTVFALRQIETSPDRDLRGTLGEHRDNVRRQIALWNNGTETAADLLKNLPRV